MTDFGFNCPAGGTWYACESGVHFVGCCTSDPCSNGCVQGNIRPGAFNATQQGSFPDASCGKASDFYTCTGESTFWGCCKTNACRATPSATCPSGDLVPAFMDRPEQFDAYLPSPPKGKVNHGAVIGGAVGGGAIALITGVIIFLLCRRRRRKQKESKLEAEGAMDATTPMMNDRRDHMSCSEQFSAQSPPSNYTSPNPNSPQPDFQAKNRVYSQTYENNYNTQAPSELPADLSTHYSELPAETSPHMASNRLSELPAGTSGNFFELESPETSPRPLQSEFSQDMRKQTQSDQGLGLSTV